MAKGVDGPGLAALLVGSVLVWAGMKGYSVMAVVQNLVTGKPIATGVTVTNTLTTPTIGSAEGKYVPLPAAAEPGMTPDDLTQAFRHLNAIGAGN